MSKLPHPPELEGAITAAKKAIVAARLRGDKCPWLGDLESVTSYLNDKDYREIDEAVSKVKEVLGE